MDYILMTTIRGRDSCVSGRNFAVRSLLVSAALFFLLDFSLLRAGDACHREVVVVFVGLSIDGLLGLDDVLLARDGELEALT